MKGIIWYYTDRKYGLDRFEQLIKDYEKIKIKAVKRSVSQFNYSVTFENGDNWILVSANTASRSQACNVGLIERGTPENIIHEIIMPCIKNYPYRAYNYY